MKITHTDGPPKDLLYFDEEMDLQQKDVEDVAEIFKTPLTDHITGTIRSLIIGLKDFMNLEKSLTGMVPLI